MDGRVYCNQAGAIHKLLVPTEPDERAGIQRMRDTANAGLVWTRYLDLWSGDAQSDGAPPDLLNGAERRAALHKFAADYNARGQLPQSLTVKLLGVVHARQSYILTRFRGGGHGEACQVTLASRFATGLGGPHPTEIGFTFDRAIGVPYLPGSSVKGLARAAARLCAEPAMEMLFGPDRIDREGDGKIGDLIFLDAYPAGWPCLEVDIINCHHLDYYAGISPYPAETDDPVPVYFLTVAAGTPWIFRLLSRSGEHAARGLELLRTGLRELGAGAKTAVGYGSFAG
jgi:CRISPR-associated protein Cmr6